MDRRAIGWWAVQATLVGLPLPLTFGILCLTIAPTRESRRRMPTSCAVGIQRSGPATAEEAAPGILTPFLERVPRRSDPAAERQNGRVAERQSDPAAERRTDPTSPR